MSFLWKKRNELASKMDGDKEGIEKMNNFRKAFQNQIEKQSHKSVSVVPKNKKKQVKRFRSAFTTMQISLLEKEFKKDPYVTNMRREHVANTLNLPERAVKIWFQNRRMKEKRDLCKGAIDIDEDIKHPVKITISDDMITKLTGTCNQQTTSTSLAAKIVFENYEILKSPALNRNDDYKISMLDVTEKDIIKQAVSKIKSDNHMVIIKTEENGPEKPGKSAVEQNISKFELQNTKYPIKENDFLQTERSPHSKQPVGHVQPFCQVSVIEPQKSPQNLSTALDPDLIEHGPAPLPMNKNPEKMSPQYPTAYPVESTSYYSPVQPVHPAHWNRYVVPIMPAGSQGLPFYASPQGPLANASQTNMCSCDCHFTANMDTVGYQRHPMFYTPYVPHFVTSLAAQNPSSKF